MAAYGLGLGEGGEIAFRLPVTAADCCCLLMLRTVAWLYSSSWDCG